jgi:hypothetical protein
MLEVSSVPQLVHGSTFPENSAIPPRTPGFDLGPLPARASIALRGKARKGGGMSIAGRKAD